MCEEAAGIRKGPSGLAAAAAAASAIATLHPHETGLLLQDAATHHLSQLLRVAPRVSGHLHPGAGQSPKHLLGAAALAQQLRVPPARPAQQTPVERGEWRVGSGQWAACRTETDKRWRERQRYGESERTNRWRKTERGLAKKDGGERQRESDIHRGGGSGVRPFPHLPHLTSRTFFSVTSTWMTMG